MKALTQYWHSSLTLVKTTMGPRKAKDGNCYGCSGKISNGLHTADGLCETGNILQRAATHALLLQGFTQTFSSACSVCLKINQLQLHPGLTLRETSPGSIDIVGPASTVGKFFVLGENDPDPEYPSQANLCWCTVRASKVVEAAVEGKIFPTEKLACPCRYTWLQWAMQKPAGPLVKLGAPGVCCQCHLPLDWVPPRNLCGVQVEGHYCHRTQSHCTLHQVKLEAATTVFCRSDWSFFISCRRCTKNIRLLEGPWKFRPKIEWQHHLLEIAVVSGTVVVGAVCVHSNPKDLRKTGLPFVVVSADQILEAREGQLQATDASTTECLACSRLTRQEIVHKKENSQRWRLFATGKLQKSQPCVKPTAVRTIPPTKTFSVTRSGKNMPQCSGCTAAAAHNRYDDKILCNTCNVVPVHWCDRCVQNTPPPDCHLCTHRPHVCLSACSRQCVLKLTQK